MRQYSQSVQRMIFASLCNNSESVSIPNPSTNSKHADHLKYRAIIHKRTKRGTLATDEYGDPIPVAKTLYLGTLALGLIRASGQAFEPVNISIIREVSDRIGMGIYMAWLRKMPAKSMPEHFDESDVQSAVFTSLCSIILKYPSAWVFARSIVVRQAIREACRPFTRWNLQRTRTPKLRAYAATAGRYGIYSNPEGIAILKEQYGRILGRFDQLTTDDIVMIRSETSTLASIRLGLAWTPGAIRNRRRIINRLLDIEPTRPIHYSTIVENRRRLTDSILDSKINDLRKRTELAKITHTPDTDMVFDYLPSPEDFTEAERAEIMANRPQFAKAIGMDYLKANGLDEYSKH